jgi:GNAT superfamily N-acetyltransferase
VETAAACGGRVGFGLMDAEIRPIREDELEHALPLIAGYQRFYEAEPDDDRNRTFFRRFVAPSEEGLLLGAWLDGRMVGFATIYWTHSSSRAADIALMNDLFVAEDVRGGGIGRALIAACADAGREAGKAVLEWYTATDNHQAQRAYDAVPGVSRSAWYSYEMDLGPDQPERG